MCVTWSVHSALSRDKMKLGSEGSAMYVRFSCVFWWGSSRPHDVRMPYFGFLFEARLAAKCSVYRARMHENIKQQLREIQVICCRVTILDYKQYHHVSNVTGINMQKSFF